MLMCTVASHSAMIVVVTRRPCIVYTREHWTPITEGCSICHLEAVLFDSEYYAVMCALAGPDWLMHSEVHTTTFVLPRYHASIYSWLNWWPEMFVEGLLMKVTMVELPQSADAWCMLVAEKDEDVSCRTIAPKMWRLEQVICVPIVFLIQHLQ